jgi:hypothetical protein
MNDVTQFFSQEESITDSSSYPVSNVARNEWKSFAMYTVESRAIPNMIDGLKPVNRMVLFSCMQNASNEFKKVSAIAGVVSSCLVGDTKILMADGNEISIEDLYLVAEDYNKIVSFDINNKKIEDDVGFNVRVSKYVNETIIIETDDGHKIECTTDHKFAVIVDGSIVYKLACDLLEEDDIISMPLGKN